MEHQDSSLLAKLSADNIIAQKAKYHPKCVVALFNVAARLKNTSEATYTNKIESIALAKLIGYIVDLQSSEDSISV